MKGLGDNIYQRAFVKNLSAHIVYLDTPWPQLYCDLPYVRCVKSNTTLRTQQKNTQRCGAHWHNWPPGIRLKQIYYNDGNIFPGMITTVGVQPSSFDLPIFPAPVIPGGKKYVVVRPATVRSEWIAESRNPDPSYIAYCATKMHELGYTVVSVADLVPNVEWLVGEEPYADIKFHRGELTVTDLMGLIQNASAVIGGIGWIVPASIAYKTPAFIICGGNGGYNNPTKITSALYQDLTKIEFAIPDNFCPCRHPIHNCNKTISRLPMQFNAWLTKMKIGAENESN